MSRPLNKPRQTHRSAVFLDGGTAVREALAHTFFHPVDQVCALPQRFTPGEGRLVLVTGENGTGKSFFRRVVHAVCQRAEVECIPLSMEGRTEAFSSMVYGLESVASTGDLSIHTVRTGISTCRARQRDHVLFWDEPDLGCSEATAGGLGRVIGAFANSLPEHTRAVFVVTHSRALVRELIGVHATPHHLAMGEGALLLTDWLVTEPVPVDVEAVEARCDQTRDRVAALLGRGRS